MIDAVIFDLFGTLIHLPRDTNPYLQLCRAISNAKRTRESLIVDALTLARFCDYLAVSHPPNLTRTSTTQDRLGATWESTLMVGDRQRSDVDGPMSCGI